MINFLNFTKVNTNTNDKISCLTLKMSCALHRYEIIITLLSFLITIPRLITNCNRHCQKEHAKSVHPEKRVKNDKIEISELIFMLTT